MSLITNIRSALGLSTNARKAEQAEALDQKALLLEEAFPSESLAPMSAVTGVRRAVNDLSTSGITPTALATMLNSAKNLSDISAYLKLAEAIEELDLHYRSVYSTRRLAVSGLERLVEATSDDTKDVQIAETLNGVVQSDMFQNLVMDLTDGLGKGFAVSETMWNTTANLWLPERFESRPQHYFEFDKTDGHTLYLKPAKLGEPLIELTRGKYLSHMPQLKSGLPIRSGLAMAASWAWLVKNIATKDWLAFVELFGQPIRYGTYAPGADRKDIAVLKQAVHSLGVDAAAVFPENMKIQFVEAGGKSASAELYLSLCNYMDSQISKLVLGQTLTTDSGGGSGSYALGKVHGDVRSDILRADAKALEATIMRDFIKPFVELNFGNVAIPKFRFVIEEAEDMEVWTRNVATMVGVGLEVEQSVVRDKLGLPEPAAGAKILVAPVAGTAFEPAPEQSANSRLPCGCPSHGEISTHSLSQDAIGSLADDLYASFEEIADPIKQVFSQAIDEATSIEDLKERLSVAINTTDLEALTEALAAARAKARLAGEAGADL